MGLQNRITETVNSRNVHAVGIRANQPRSRSGIAVARSPKCETQNIVWLHLCV